jgi:hypothetical protein
MLSIIEDGSEIKRCQGKFEQAFKRVWDKKVYGFAGHMGKASYDERNRFNWSGELGMWGIFEKIVGSRYWNAFGLEEPKEGALRSILTEINFPLKGVDHRVAGVFAKDESGKIFVCHSGRIGGGRPGIGKELFKDNYWGKKVMVSDGEREEEYALIGDVNSSRFPYQVREFILAVDKIKKMGTGEIKKIEPKEKSGFTPEFSGKRRFKLNKEIVSDSDHGYVVGELARLLEAKNLTIGNDRNRDLYILDKKGNILTLFEVKTDTQTGSLYSGVGQLLLNSFLREKRPKLVLVIPEQMDHNIEEGLRGMGIECLTYQLETKGVSFDKHERFY